MQNSIFINSISNFIHSIILLVGVASLPSFSKRLLWTDLQQDSTVGVHIGPGVLGLALLQQHVGDNLVELSHQLEHGVIGQVLQGKLTLTFVAWVSLPQNCMAIARYHLRPK